MELAWHASAGKASKKTDALFHDPEATTRVAICAVVVETPRKLAISYLDASHDVVSRERTADQWPPLLNLLNEDVSLLEHGLQYLATLLAMPDKCPRLSLAFRQRNCRTFREWQARFPDDVHLFQQGVMHMHASLDRRQRVYLEDFLVFTTSDERRPLSKSVTFDGAFEDKVVYTQRPINGGYGVRRAVKDWFGSRVAAPFFVTYMYDCYTEPVWYAIKPRG